MKPGHIFLLAGAIAGFLISRGMGKSLYSQIAFAALGVVLMYVLITYIENSILAELSAPAPEEQTAQ